MLLRIKALASMGYWHRCACEQGIKVSRDYLEGEELAYFVSTDPSIN